MTLLRVETVSTEAFVATIDAQDRFNRSGSVRADIGPTSKRYQSGDIGSGRSATLGNRMIERIWRSFKYKCVCLNPFVRGSQIRAVTRK
ncbi:hypothetical protein [Pseudorhodobacter aquimaris]|uniref:hypothetical protein n=1 Tax=Pseudorhodobacter aquimaris TaxID=687412 RepID=UPI0038CD611A